MADEFFLVTGASGYIACHVVDQLLKQGYRVRGTVRNLNDEKKVEPLRKLSENSKHKLELVEADLQNAESWKQAVKDITIIMHVASPLPVVPPTDEQEVIKPAVEGTLNVLNAALNTNVKRIVLTSSGLAVTGYTRENRTYSEADWPDLDKMQLAYGKSKVLAERAAWNFIEEKKNKNESCFELVVIHPTLVMGPLLNKSTGTSATRFLSVFKGQLDKVPALCFFTCDVRDVALAHIKGAFSKDAVNHRHLLVSSPQQIPMLRWAQILNEEFGPRGYKFSLEAEQNEPNDKDAKIDDTRMRTVLGITPTDFKSTIIDMANSFIQQNLV